MTPRQTPAPTWWKLPSVIVGIVAGLGAAGTAIIKTASFLSLNDRVEAQERKNLEQDKVLDKLSVIEDQNAQLLKVLSTDIRADATKVNEVDDDGEVKVMQMGKKTLCCNGHDCWSWHPKTQCARE